VRPPRNKCHGIPKQTTGVSDRSPPGWPVQLLLRIGLLGAVLGVFLSDAISDVDWEILQTKHYWSAETWYYGGYAAQLFGTPRGFRTINAEALCNCTNMLALQERAPAGKARHPVQGFPGTERLASSFLVYALLHATGGASNVWSVFWLANVLLWLLSICLAYKIAGLFFDDSCSPWIAAILVALYPALTLTFNAVKQQPLGTTYFLLGMYLVEGRLKESGFLFRVAALAAVFFLGQFADGGWIFLAAYLFLRLWWIPGRGKWTALACLGLALGLSELWLAWLGSLYHLPSVIHALRFSFGRMLGESWRWLGAWMSGSDVSQMSFLNFPGFTFFSVFWPLICKGFLSNHAVLLVVAVAGLFLEPRTRMFTFLAVPMLFVGHSGVIVTGWLFYYGYLSFPAAMMLIFAASAVLGGLAARRGSLPRLAALAIAVCACWSFTGQKKQAGIYYGEGPDYYLRSIEVHYGNETKSVDY
jgi:hypothetical protein